MQCDFHIFLIESIQWNVFSSLSNLFHLRALYLQYRINLTVFCWMMRQVLVLCMMPLWRQLSEFHGHCTDESLQTFISIRFTVLPSHESSRFSETFASESSNSEFGCSTKIHVESSTKNIVAKVVRGRSAWGASKYEILQGYRRKSRHASVQLNGKMFIMQWP